MASVAPALFLEKPRVLYVDEAYSVKPPPYSTIENLIKSLQEHGPLIAVGKMGPAAYTKAPFKFIDRTFNREIYGWKPGAFKEFAPRIPVILLGVRQTDLTACIYFTLAKDITADEESLVRGYQPLQTDTNVYAMTYENFINRSLSNLHSICPHAEWLYSVPVNTILVGGEVENKCRQLGQEIFNHYKTNAQGNSEEGKYGMIRMCEAAKALTQDGSVRKAHIERAWNGVGDDNWRWEC